jgi:hypothetical protein
MPTTILGLSRIISSRDDGVAEQRAEVARPEFHEFHAAVLELRHRRVPRHPRRDVAALQRQQAGCACAGRHDLHVLGIETGFLVDALDIGIGMDHRHAERLALEEAISD